MVKIGKVTCPRCHEVFDIDKMMLSIPEVYFHCPYCGLEPIKLNEAEINLGSTRMTSGERYESM